ncbi:MAG: stage 0 sporulation family protein [Oscillospiraceae bacterium]|jgi:cell fate regulator YaaT (PSP1 superfamily)|nr:stage 0 sporulation family protein [Oscillospiraceae bacterium]
MDHMNPTPAPHENPQQAATVKEPVTVCDIQFRVGSKVYFFDPGKLEVREGDEVIIDTARGPEFGLCTAGNHLVQPHEVVAPLRPVLRLATENDKRIEAENRKREKHAFDVCLRKIEEQGLQMQLVSAEYAFDGSKILFFFTADGRVDFRELVKSLAATLRTRIELRQIGVRDKARMVGGLGICGRPFCCKEFLDDFQPVSIKMAKTQNLSLNPTKISGTCGRLMCCLNYEQAAYEDLIKNSPKQDSLVDTPDGRGTVTDINLLRQSVKVRLEKQPDTCVCHKNCDICVLRNGKAKKTDAPIPDDLAPISGNLNRRKKKEEFTTYLEPVVMRRSAEVLEEARTNGAEAAQEQKRRNRRGGKKLGKVAEKIQAAEQTTPEMKLPQNAPAHTPKPPVQEQGVASEAGKSKKPNRRYHRRRKPGAK